MIIWEEMFMIYSQKLKIIYKEKRKGETPSFFAFTLKYKPRK
jgi:hypothetical protein